jgi:hypothetical protein
MTTLRPFTADDLFKFNHINLDPLTETYSSQFYMVSTPAHSVQCTVYSIQYTAHGAQQYSAHSAQCTVHSA